MSALTEEALNPASVEEAMRQARLAERRPMARIDNARAVTHRKREIPIPPSQLQTLVSMGSRYMVALPAYSDVSCAIEGCPHRAHVALESRLDEIYDLRPGPGRQVRPPNYATGPRCDRHLALATARADALPADRPRT